jgi:hypothetical protein
MNKTLRLAALSVLALVLTCLCLAGPGPHRKIPLSICIQRCERYCGALGLVAMPVCHPCRCYLPASGCGGCAGFGDGCGGYSGGCSGGDGRVRRWWLRRRWRVLAVDRQGQRL